MEIAHRFAEPEPKFACSSPTTTVRHVHEHHVYVRDERTVKRAPPPSQLEKPDEFELAGYVESTRPDAVRTAKELLTDLKRRRSSKRDADILFDRAAVWAGPVARRVRALGGADVPPRPTNGATEDMYRELRRACAGALLCDAIAAHMAAPHRESEAVCVFVQDYHSHLWEHRTHAPVFHKHRNCEDRPCRGCMPIHLSINEQFPPDELHMGAMAPGQLRPYDWERIGADSGLPPAARELEAVRDRVYTRLGGVYYCARRRVDLPPGSKLELYTHFARAVVLATHTSWHCRIRCPRHTRREGTNCACTGDARCRLCVCLCTLHARRTARPPLLPNATPNAVYFEYGCTCRTLRHCGHCSCSCADEKTIVLCSNPAHVHCTGAKALHDVRNPRCSPVSPWVVSPLMDIEAWQKLLRFTAELSLPAHSSVVVRTFVRLLKKSSSLRPLYECLFNFAGKHAPADAPEPHWSSRAFWFDAHSVWHVMFAVLLFETTTAQAQWTEVWHLFSSALHAHCNYCPSCYIRTREALHDVLVLDAMAPVLPLHMARRIEHSLLHKLQYRRADVERKCPRKPKTAKKRKVQ